MCPKAFLGLFSSQILWRFLRAKAHHGRRLSARGKVRILSHDHISERLSLSQKCSKDPKPAAVFTCKRLL
jgi:hypothetical protein